MSVTSIDSAPADPPNGAAESTNDDSLIQNPHSCPTEAVVDELRTSTEHGLGVGEAQKRLDSVGPNSLPEPPKPNVVIRFLSHFNDILIYILLVAAVVTGLMGHYVDTIVIGVDRDHSFQLIKPLADALQFFLHGQKGGLEFFQWDAHGVDGIA